MCPKVQVSARTARRDQLANLKIKLNMKGMEKCRWHPCCTPMSYVERSLWTWVEIKGRRGAENRQNFRWLNRDGCVWQVSVYRLDQDPSGLFQSYIDLDDEASPRPRNSHLQRFFLRGWGTTTVGFVDGMIGSEAMVLLLLC